MKHKIAPIFGNLSLISLWMKPNSTMEECEPSPILFWGPRKDVTASLRFKVQLSRNSS